MDFALYRGLDPIVGRWYQVDPLSEDFMSMSPFCAMGNNPVNQSDYSGDSPLHIAAAVIGAGINVYNNWSNILRNPYSAASYAVIGAVAGAASLSPGGPMLAAKITIAGNIATDLATGNFPKIGTAGEALEYATNSVGNAMSVMGGWWSC